MSKYLTFAGDDVPHGELLADLETYAVFFTAEFNNLDTGEFLLNHPEKLGRDFSFYLFENFWYQEFNPDEKDPSRIPRPVSSTTRDLVGHLKEKHNILRISFNYCEPGARLPWHTHRNEFTNILCHVGIDVPDGDCSLRIEDEQISWENNRAFAFESTTPHCMWNATEKSRTIMLLDCLKPGYSKQDYIEVYCGNEASSSPRYESEVLDDYDTLPAKIIEYPAVAINDEEKQNHQRLYEGVMK